jgi:AcrR family transcriptional regulator
MAGKRPLAPIRTEALRAAVAVACADSTLRAVAEAVGVSKSTLHYFLQGGEPHAATTTKLRRWVVRTAADAVQRGEPLPAVDAVYAALTLLVCELPAGVQAATAARILDLVLEAAQGQPPSWFAVVAGASSMSQRSSPTRSSAAGEPRQSGTAAEDGNERT